MAQVQNIDDILRNPKNPWLAGPAQAQVAKGMLRRERAKGPKASRMPAMPEGIPVQPRQLSTKKEEGKAAQDLRKNRTLNMLRGYGLLPGKATSKDLKNKDLKKIKKESRKDRKKRKKAAKKEGDTEQEEKKFSEDEKLDGWIFYAVLFISILKDVLDLAHVLLGAASFGVLYVVGFVVIWIANIVISALLVMLFFLKFKKGAIVIKSIKRYIIPVVAEFIPIIKVFPVYTFVTLYFHHKDKKKYKKRIYREELTRKALSYVKT